MAEFSPVSDLADMFGLVDAEVQVGYRLGAAGVGSPASHWSRSVWHGWRNGRVDAGLAERDEAQRLLSYRWQMATGFTDGLPVH